MIYIVPDTNIFSMSYTRSAAYDLFFLNKNFNEIINSIEKDRFRDQVRLLIPKMVLEELYIQKIESYEKDVKELNRITENMASLISVERRFDLIEEYKCFLRDKVQEFLSGHGEVEIMPVCDERFFKDIVEKAIKKEAPFEGKEKNSDKGFKDTVIFFSMVDFAGTHKGEFYYLTQDTKFHGDDGKLLRRQFRELSGSVLSVFKEYKQVRPEITLAESETHVDCLVYTFSEKTCYLGPDRNKTTTVLTHSKPQFQASENSLQRIVFDIDRIYDDDMAFWRQQDLQTYDDENMEYSGSLTADVKYNKDGIWGVLFIHYVYTGGAHGGSWYTSRVYDLNTGENLSLTKLLGRPEEEILQMVYERCREDKFKRREEDLYFEEFEAKYDSVEDVKFYLTEEGIMVYFDEYEAGCYASGMIEFLLAPIAEVEFRR